MKTQTTAYKDLMDRTIRPPSLIKVEVTVGADTYTFREDVIVKATKIDEVDPLSRRLPTQTFSFSVADPTGQYDPSNPSGKWEAFDKNNPVAVAFGLDINGTETWLAADTYYLEGVPSYTNGVATFRAQGRLNSLTKTYYLSPSSPNYYTAVQDVFSAAGVSSSDYDVDAYELNRRVGNTTRGGIATYAETLQRLAHAAGMALYTRNGKICMQRFLQTNWSFPTMITQDEIASYTMQKETPCGTINKRSYKVEFEPTTETLWTGQIDMGTGLNVKAVIIPFDFPVLIDSVTVSGATLIAQFDAMYASRIGLSGSGVCTVTVTGYRGQMDTSESPLTIGTGAGVETIDNPLLNFEDTTDLPAAWLLQDYEFYMPLRNTYALKHRGTDVLETGDCITFQSPDPLIYINCLVLGVNTEYNGALSTTLTLKEISTTPKLPKVSLGANYNLGNLIISRTSVDDEEFDIYVNGTLTTTVQCGGAVTLVSFGTLGIVYGVYDVKVIAKGTGYFDSDPAEITVRIDQEPPYLKDVSATPIIDKFGENILVQGDQPYTSTYTYIEIDDFITEVE